MNHGGAAITSFGRVKLSAAIHSSSMPDGSYGGNPAGFLVETKDGNFYYSGDTALTSDMKLIADETELRFAVLPIGDFFTMGVKDAVRARISSARTRSWRPLRYLFADQARPRGGNERRQRWR